MPKAKESNVTKGKRRTGQTVGYLRVSSLDQKKLRQLEGIALDKRFVDKARVRTRIDLSSSCSSHTCGKGTRSSAPRWTGSPATSMIVGELCSISLSAESTSALRKRT